MAETVSNKPWSDFKPSDYSDEQWLKACLIDRGPSAGTAKQRGSLPVREPNGTLNRNALSAAAAALAGARGGLKGVAPELKALAKRKLAKLYSVANMTAPDSLKHSSIDPEDGPSGNTEAVLVALPAPLEQIRLVGDEEKHTSLMYFGETSTLPENAKQILTDSVKLATTMLMPFGESVRDITRLGTDNPPALVAMLSNRNLGTIRSLFMMNPDVKGYLDNTTQFPQFTPHMTLAYPDFTDEMIIRALARQLYAVRFDRLAVWWNDERIEFPLQGNGDAQDSDSLAMSDVVEKFLAEHGEEDDHLEHHGVKGQKWGVRRPVNAATGLVTRTLKGKMAEESTTTKLKPRTSSADQIHQDRIASKIKEGGTKSLSNADIQAYTRRLQLQQDLDRALASQSAATQKAADGFIKSFVKSQGSRQLDRVANKAVDIAIEKAIENTGIQLGKKNPSLGKDLGELSRRLKPKKK